MSLGRNSNVERFPDDFMLQLSWAELRDLKFHFGTSSWSGTRKRPRAFTEQGVAMLSSVLRRAPRSLVLIGDPQQLEQPQKGTHPKGVNGTVDKFQGQEAPIVLYSMATSTPEDAPRGMEFLYSLNRLDVATSRARCAAILVAGPRLYEPECRTPRQMKLANALCRYRELARPDLESRIGAHDSRGSDA